MTDPLLLDAIEEHWRRTRDARPALPPRPSEQAPVAATRRIETPFSGPVDVPVGHLEEERTADGRDRWIETPFSGPVVVRAEQAVPPVVRGPRALSAEAPVRARAAQPPAAAVAPQTLPVMPRSLPALLGEVATATPRADAETASPGRAAEQRGSDQEHHDAEAIAVGLSVRSLLMALGVGTVAAVALSVVAVLPL